MHVAPYDIKITLKSEDNKLIKEFKGVEDLVTLADGDPVLSGLVSVAQQDYVGQPDEIIVTCRYQWK